MLDSQKVGGALDQAKRQTFLQRFGVENPSQSDIIKSKKSETLMLHYGVPFASQSDEIKQKTEHTNLERHGHVCNLHGKSSRKKIDSMLAEHGVRNIAQRPDVADKIKQTMLSKHGSENALSSPVIREKIKNVLMQKYGVKSATELPQFKESKRSQQAAQRRHETMKKNGTYRKSKPEDALYEKLCEKFGSQNIDRNVPIPGTRWSIDFHVKHIDIYIQFDGVYWHGLDRPIEVIAEHRNNRDVVIHKKWLTDRQQDLWFRESGLCLIRVNENFVFDCLIEDIFTSTEQRIMAQ